MKKKSNLIKFVCLFTVLSIVGCSKKSDSKDMGDVSIDSVPMVKNNEVLPKTDSIVVASEKSVNYDCEECLKKIEKIVRSSEYNEFFKKTYKKNYSILVDEATKQKVTIQIVIDESTPMGWLELNLDDKVLNDVTNDPENPKFIKSSDEMINDFKINCLKCCLD